MDKAVWHEIVLVLKQKSTLVGLASLIAIIYSLFGSDMTPEQVASVTGALGALLSVVAIILQPKPSGGHYKNTDYKIGDSYSDPDGTTRVFNGEVWE